LERVQQLIPSTIIDDRLNLADWEQRDANIPLRNAFLVMIASFYDNDVILVVQKGEMEIPDRSKWFYNTLPEVLTRLQDRVITLSSPFFTMTKTDMVKWYIQDGLDTDKLIATRSCFSPGDMPCGNCAACFRRWVAFTNNNLKEKYEQDITKYLGINDYIKKMKMGLYDPDRTKETFDALKKVGIL
jgi:7-cyano-7-deazaguanine synthase in queuosine biosynthesis